jgi:hypothetical protein
VILFMSASDPLKSLKGFPESFRRVRSHSPLVLVCFTLFELGQAFLCKQR